jgi:YihY family inner membrane protein
MLGKIDRFQQRHAMLAIPLAVVKKFGNDNAGSLAALIAYYGFFALFPLLLLFTTILGFVLQGNQSAQQSVIHSALGQFPIIGNQLSAHSLTGSGFALAVGIVGTVLSGLGVTNAGQNAFNQVYGVPYRARPNFVQSRLRGLGTLTVLGVLQVISTAASGAVSGGLGGPGLAVAGIALSLVLNLILFFATFRMLTDNSVPTRELWPGIITGAILWEILQAIGGVYVGHVVKKASNTYGTFATVIGLITWLHLGAQAVLYSAELNTVLSLKLWPRSLFGHEREEDKRTLARIAKTEERAEPERVHVTFEGGGAESEGTDADRPGAEGPDADRPESQDKDAPQGAKRSGG